MIQDFECYKRLENRPDVRHSHILKHIVNLQCQEHSIYGESHLAEKIKSLIANGTLSREKYRPLNDLPPHSWEREEAIKETSGKLQWILDTTDLVFNLSILARTTDYAITLQSDFLVCISSHTINDTRSYSLSCYSLYSNTNIITIPSAELPWLSQDLSGW